MAFIMIIGRDSEVDGIFVESVKKVFTRCIPTIGEKIWLSEPKIEGDNFTILVHNADFEVSIMAKWADALHKELFADGRGSLLIANDWDLIESPEFWVSPAADVTCLEQSFKFWRDSLINRLEGALELVNTKVKV